MAKTSTDTVRRQLGELAAMQASSGAMDKQILERAEQLLEQVDATIKKTRAAALTDERAASEYQEAIAERGRLQQVIAQARAHSSS